MSAALTEDGEDLIVHVVNDSDRERRCTIDVSAVAPDPGPADAWQVADTRHAGSADAMNSFDDPERVRTLMMPAAGAGPMLDCELPALSVTALSVRRSDCARSP